MKTIIIGAGASGLMASLKIKGDVVILERNSEAGKKILVTGNGRCNISNTDQDLSHYHSNSSQYLKEIFTTNNLDEMFSTFKDIGIELREKNGYLYPYSNQASSVRDAFLTNINNRRNITIVYDTIVSSIKYSDDEFVMRTNNGIYTADKLVVAVGSNASSMNDNNLLNILENMGHTIIKPLPALVKLNTNLGIEKKWSGIRCDALLSHYENDNYIRSEVGELQLTDNGISGICVMNLSSDIARGLYKNKKEIISINFLHGLNLNSENIDKFLEERDKYINLPLKNLFTTIINNKLINILFNYYKIDSNKYYHELSEIDKDNIKNMLTNFNINIISTKSFSNAQTISGGVRLDDICVNTMESKKQKHLFIVGELLDINGDCGGYNLTNAFITGILAGRGVNND